MAEEAQSISFIGDSEEQMKQPRRSYNEESKPLMDYPTQRALIDSSRNYNKMVNNMFRSCANVCINRLNTDELTRLEEKCLENCYEKYFHTFFQGGGFLRKFMNNDFTKQVETTTKNQ